MPGTKDSQENTFYTLEHDKDLDVPPPMYAEVPSSSPNPSHNLPPSTIRSDDSIHKSAPDGYSYAPSMAQTTPSSYSPLGVNTSPYHPPTTYVPTNVPVAGNLSSRAPQTRFSYTPFPPCHAVSVGKTLGSGFPVLPPASHLQPHPFVTHDINEEDWTKFLANVKNVAVASADYIHTLGGTAPISMGMGMIPGVISSKEVGKHVERQKISSAIEVINQWNQLFFVPRMMEVSLVNGRSVYSGSGTLPPELAQEGYKREYESDDSSSDSDSDDERRQNKRKNEWPAPFTPEWSKKVAVGLVTGTGWSETREDRKERKMKKRAQKEERKEEKRERKEDRKAMRRERKRKVRSEVVSEPWKLVITYKPHVL